MSLHVFDEGRRFLESRMTEMLLFYRLGDGVDENGVPTTDAEIPVHSGVRGRVKFASAVVSNRESGAQLVAVQQREVHVPVGAAPDVREGDLCRVTASDADAGLVGRLFRVSGLPDAGQVTSHRYPVTEVS